MGVEWGQGEEWGGGAEVWDENVVVTAGMAWWGWWDGFGMRMQM